MIETYLASSNETDFLSRNGGTNDSGGFTDMLMITTTVRVINRVHGHTMSTGPASLVSQYLHEWD